MKSKYSHLPKEYPSIIRQAELCKICHISKRKAVWLLEHGYIPCQDTKKKTRRFTIQLADVIKYLKRLEAKPEIVCIPAGIFSSGGGTKGKIPIIYDTQKLRAIIAQSLMESTDVLSVAQASELVGYSKSAVSRWVASGRLRFFQGIYGRIIATEDLIDYMASDYATRIAMKSEIHREWLKRYRD